MARHLSMAGAVVPIHIRVRGHNTPGLRVIACDAWTCSGHCLVLGAVQAVGEALIPCRVALGSRWLCMALPGSLPRLGIV